MNLSRYLLFTMFFLNFLAANQVFAGSGIPVYFLTPRGSISISHQTDSKLLKSWSDLELQKLVKSGIGKSGEIPIAKFFEESAKDLDWKNRAEIDLLTIYGQKPEELVRLPRFMVVRSAVKLHYFRLSGRISLEVIKPSELNGIPKKALELNSVTKIEFTQKKITYPGLSLKVRTNPAASRGEKLYTQNCMSCHSVPGVKPIQPTMLIKEQFDRFATSHPDFRLVPRDVRGLEAYRDALASEKNEVKSSK